jgi:hypothetical protein
MFDCQSEKTEKETQRLAKETNSHLKQLMLLEGDTPSEKVTKLKYSYSNF